MMTFLKSPCGGSVALKFTSNVVLVVPSMPKSKEELSTTSSSDSDSEAETKVVSLLFYINSTVLLHPDGFSVCLFFMSDIHTSLSKIVQI